MECIEWKHLIVKTLSVPLLRGMTCWSGQYSSPYAGGLVGVSSVAFIQSPRKWFHSKIKKIFDRP